MAEQSITINGVETTLTATGFATWTASDISLRSVIFIAVSTDGTETYKTAPTACSCPAGIKGSRCYHQLAARMLLAA